MLVLISVAFGVIGGLTTALTGIGGEKGTWPNPDYQRPIFFVINSLLYGVSVLLGIVNLLIGLWSKFKGMQVAWLAVFISLVGPLLVAWGFAFSSHYIDCHLVPGLCKENSFTGSMHQLHHTLVGAVPFAIIYVVTHKLSIGINHKEKAGV
jgi:hypothetical protein